MEDYQISPEIMVDCTKELKMCSPDEHQGKTIHCLMDLARARKRERDNNQQDVLTPRCRRTVSFNIDRACLECEIREK